MTDTRAPIPGMDPWRPEYRFPIYEMALLPGDVLRVPSGFTAAERVWHELTVQRPQKTPAAPSLLQALPSAALFPLA